jgi:hypothetical protein
MPFSSGPEEYCSSRYLPTHSSTQWRSLIARGKETIVTTEFTFSLHDGRGRVSRNSLVIKVLLVHKLLYFLSPATLLALNPKIRWVSVAYVLCP